MLLQVPLSKLVSGRKNPRRVKPEADAHRRLVASIGAHGLLEPLVVRPANGNSGRFEVIAGSRRLAALKEVHRGTKKDPRIACEVRKVEDSAAEALSLAENFVREAMHPLDEAQTFATLAGVEGKNAEAIAADFGVAPRYIRQRMKLATLAGDIQAAYRSGAIDTATAEAFAAVPQDRQLLVWQELRGNPRHAEQVRNVIANSWIDASCALFDVGKLPASAVSRDLFSDKVLVERRAFMEAQSEALATQRQALIEEGWAEAVVGRREDVQDRLYAMDTPPREFDDQTQRKLKKIADRREKLEAAVAKIDDGDQPRIDRIQAKYEELETAEAEVLKAAPMHFSDATKSAAIAFLLLDPDGQVHREYRVPRRRPTQSAAGANGAEADGGNASEKSEVRTSDDLSDGQLGTTFTHQALAVREALLDCPKVRKRILAMILHEKVRSEALAIRHDANAVTLHATSGTDFTSPALMRLQKARTKVDPLQREHSMDECEAYEQFAKTSDTKLDALIEVLTVECLTAHMLRRTELMQRLATELDVDVRKYWRPDASWLASYQKIQLTHLLAQLRGQTYSPNLDQRKKSELMHAVAQLFTDAAEGKVEDKALAERVNRWLPPNLRPKSEDSR